MLRKTILCALATGAMIPAAAALAQHGGGHGGGPPAGAGGMGNGGGNGNGNSGLGSNGGLSGTISVGPGAGMGPGAGAGASGGASAGMGSVGVQTRDTARMNSQGPANASPTGIAHANQNSVLTGTTATNRVTTGTLSGLTTGMTLFSNGTAVGTVQQIRTTGNGSVAVVLVRGTNGGLFAIPANKLTLSGGTLSTMARLNGINGSSQARVNSQGPLHASPTGIAHANQHSVLASGAVASASLPGLTTGLTVQTSTGTTLGRVTQVVTGSNGSIRLVVVQSSTGQTFRLSPSMLSIAGGVVTTTQSIG